VAGWDFSARKESALREIVERLRPLDPRLVLLFGSRATGSGERPDSDFDLVVVMETQAAPAERVAEIERRFYGLGVPTDVVVYTPEEWERFRGRPLSLARRALGEGRVLHGG
jgi:predicted nucleotidyltransferase